MDRGANGSIIGSDMRLISTQDQYIDLSGIDDHTVRHLQMVTAGAVAETQKGSIIAIIHQGASMPDGKTILSPGQLEKFGCKVFDRAKAITGTNPYLETLEGYRIPLSVRRGLPYTLFRPFTDEEWNTLPHVDLTSPHPWDPSCLDSIVDQDWYRLQPDLVAPAPDNPIAVDGELRETDDTDFLMAEDTPNQPFPRQEVFGVMAHLIHDELIPEYDVDSDEGSPARDAHAVKTRSQCRTPRAPGTPRHRQPAPPPSPLPRSSAAGERLPPSGRPSGGKSASAPDDLPDFMEHEDSSSSESEDSNTPQST